MSNRHIEYFSADSWEKLESAIEYLKEKEHD